MIDWIPEPSVYIVVSSVLSWSTKFMSSVRSFIHVVKDLFRCSCFGIKSLPDFGRFSLFIYCFSHALPWHLRSAHVSRALVCRNED